MRWSARVSISRCTARPFIDEIRLGRRPGTALAVGGSQRKLGPLTFLALQRHAGRPDHEHVMLSMPTLAAMTTPRTGLRWSVQQITHVFWFFERVCMFEPIAPQSR